MGKPDGATAVSPMAAAAAAYYGQYATPYYAAAAQHQGLAGGYAAPPNGFYGTYAAWPNAYGYPHGCQQDFYWNMSASDAASPPSAIYKQ